MKTVRDDRMNEEYIFVTLGGFSIDNKYYVTKNRKHKFFPIQNTLRDVMSGDTMLVALPNKRARTSTAHCIYRPIIAYLIFAEFCFTFPLSLPCLVCTPSCGQRMVKPR